MDSYYSIHIKANNIQDTASAILWYKWITIYSSLIVSTTLLCTLLIIYRIVTVSSTNCGGIGLWSYKGAIEILVESSLLYSITALISAVLIGKRSVIEGNYVSTITAITRVSFYLYLFILYLLCFRELHLHF